MQGDFVRGVFAVRPTEDGGVEIVFGGSHGARPVAAAIGAALATALFSPGCACECSRSCNCCSGTRPPLRPAPRKVRARAGKARGGRP